MEFCEFLIFKINHHGAGIFCRTATIDDEENITTAIFTINNASNKDNLFKINNFLEEYLKMKSNSNKYSTLERKIFNRLINDFESNLSDETKLLIEVG